MLKVQKQGIDKLLEIMRFIESISVKIHGALDEKKIFRIIKEEFASHTDFKAVSILLLDDSGLSLHLVDSSIQNNRGLKQGEKIAKVSFQNYKIKLKKSKTYTQVIKHGKTIQLQVVDLIKELFPRIISASVAKILNYKKEIVILTPLSRQGKVIGALAVSSIGLSDYLVPSVKNLAQHISNALDIAYEYAERKKVEKEIVYKSFHDDLTGLYNRAFFEKEMGQIDKKENLPISIIMGDADCLKIINDGFGHLEGDNLLRSIAQTLKMACRKNDLPARWGGDEFIALLPKTSEKKTLKICAQIKHNCSESKQSIIAPHISLGAASKTKPDQKIEGVIMMAEDRMYLDKIQNEKNVRKIALLALQNKLNKKCNINPKHHQRLQKLAINIGRYLCLPKAEIDSLGQLAIFHDIGKIAISSHIFTKPGPLSAEEWKEIKRHSDIGYRIAKSLPELTPIAQAIRAHHEWWNGKGYPLGLKAEQIPFPSRVLAIVDTYDIMVYGNRPYKKNVSPKEALKELRKFAGAQFDPKLVNVFTEMILRQELSPKAK